MSADDKIDIIINPPEGRGQASELLEEPRSRDEDLARLRRELQSRDDELALSRALVTRIYSSWSWRVTLPLRFVRQIAGTIRRQSVRLADGLGRGRLFAHTVFGDGTKSKAREARLPLPSRATSKELETEIQLLQRSGLFDEQFYRQANPDVAAVGISPLAHYLSIGAFEGRRPNRLFDSAYYLRTYSDVAEAGVNPALHYFLNGALEGRNPSVEFDTSYYLEANLDVATSGINPLVHFLCFGRQEGRFPRRECYELELQQLGRLAAARYGQEKLDYRPLVSILMRTYNTASTFLEAAVRSVVAQAYPHWELRIVDDGSSNSATLDALGRIAACDKRIFVTRNARHDGISGARNDALHNAGGEYVAMLDPDDELAFDALYEVVLALNTDRTTDVVYTDQGYASPRSEPTTHIFKPDWSPSLFRGVMYVGHLLTVRRSLALDVGGFASAFDPVQDFEFMLRVSERTHKIRHIPKALYHQRRIPGLVGAGGNADGDIEQLQTAAVQAQLERLGLDGRARPNPRHPHRVVIEAARHPQNTTLDLIINNHAVSKTADTSTVDLLDFKADRGVSEADRLSRFLRESSGEFVLAMSDEVAIDTDDWMELLLLAAQERDVAVVCPAVLSANGIIAHAGLVVGRDATARPAMRGFEPESDGYNGSLSCAREISAAWADVVLLRRSLLATLLTPNPVYATANFLVADLTLRATRLGLRAVCVPYVRARRLSTIEADSDHRLDGLLFEDLWGGKAVVDPFYNPNFVKIRAD